MQMGQGDCGLRLLGVLNTRKLSSSDTSGFIVERCLLRICGMVKKFVESRGEFPNLLTHAPDKPLFRGPQPLNVIKVTSVDNP